VLKKVCYITSVATTLYFLPFVIAGSMIVHGGIILADKTSTYICDFFKLDTEKSDDKKNIPQLSLFAVKQA